jgi:hypothetical protein
MKNRFCSSRAGFRYTPPARVARTLLGGAADTIAHKLDVSMVFVCGPVALKIMEELRPSKGQPMLLEICQRKREAMVDADECQTVFG